jgi:uncharacterized membrane protein YhiD involved in acid resistance
MNWIDFGIRMLAAAVFWRRDRVGTAVAAAHDGPADERTGFRRRGDVRHDGWTRRRRRQPGTGCGLRCVGHRVLGGGVILKDGFNIRGLNTAATLWCAAAVGTLAGLGHMEFAAMGAAGVLLANLVLRPVARLINRSPAESAEQELLYRLRCVCRTSDEAKIRAMLLQSVQSKPLTLMALHSNDDELLARVNVRAYLRALGAKESFLEQIVTRLSLEPGVTAISWEVAAAVDSEDASITTAADVVRAT